MSEVDTSVLTNGICRTSPSIGHSQASTAQGMQSRRFTVRVEPHSSRWRSVAFDFSDPSDPLHPIVEQEWDVDVGPSLTLLPTPTLWSFFEHAGMTRAKLTCDMTKLFGIHHVVETSVLSSARKPVRIPTPTSSSTNGMRVCIDSRESMKGHQ